MRSDNLKNHMKIHDKHVNVEPSPTISTTIPSTYTTPVYESSGSKLTNMDEEMLLNSMLKDDREYKEKIEVGKKMYQFVKEYDIDENSLSKTIRNLQRTKTKCRC